MYPNPPHHGLGTCSGRVPACGPDFLPLGRPPNPGQTTTADTPNRLRDKQQLEEAWKLPEFGTEVCCVWDPMGKEPFFLIFPSIPIFPLKSHLACEIINKKSRILTVLWHFLPFQVVDFCIKSRGFSAKMQGQSRTPLAGWR